MVKDDLKLTREDVEEMEPIYSGDLDFETIKKKPILKPIAEMNNSYINFELLINRALWEYAQNKEAIDEMIEINPKYSETMIMHKIQNILGHVKQIIHSQNLEKENMKKAINEMIKIAEQDYALLEEDTEKPQEEIKIKEIKKKDKINKEKEMVEKPKKFFSDLVGKEITLPDEKEIVPTSKHEENETKNNQN